MSKRTTREKLLSYLSIESKKANASTFTIPFNRQQLADYLSVDRSAMSNELCKIWDLGGLPEGEWNLKKRYGAGNSIIAFLLIVFLKNREGIFVEFQNAGIPYFEPYR